MGSSKTQADAKEKTNSKPKKKQTKKQRFTTSKRDKVAEIVFTHNFKQAYEPAEFINAVRAAVAMPKLDEAAIYKLGWEVIRSVRTKYPDTKITLPKETKAQRVLRVFEEFSSGGTAEVISSKHNQTLKTKPPEKPKRKTTKPKPKQKLKAGQTERRGVRKGLTDDEKMDIIINTAKVRTGDLPDRRKR
jgi:hypothetical protein